MRNGSKILIHNNFTGRANLTRFFVGQTCDWSLCTPRRNVVLEKVGASVWNRDGHCVCIACDERGQKKVKSERTALFRYSFGERTTWSRVRLCDSSLVVQRAFLHTPYSIQFLLTHKNKTYLSFLFQLFFITSIFML